MNQSFSKIWIIVIIILIIAFFTLQIVWSKPPIRIYQDPCLTDFDCYLRIGPLNYMMGYRASCSQIGYRAGCFQKRCIIITPEGIGPLIK